MFTKWFWALKAMSQVCRVTGEMKTAGDDVPDGYGELLAQVKREVTEAQVRAARVVNVELIELYWRIGRLIFDRKHLEGWGTRVIDRLSADLRPEFPGMRGFAQRSLVYMRTFGAAWPDPITQGTIAQLPWSHIATLLDKVKNPATRSWYAAEDVGNGWSRAVLAHHNSTDRHGRVGAAQNNFPDVLPAVETHQAANCSKTLTNWTSSRWNRITAKRDLEDALVARLTNFLAELGSGFAFVGRQYKLPVGRTDNSSTGRPHHLPQSTNVDEDADPGSAERPREPLSPHRPWSVSRLRPRPGSTLCIDQLGARGAGPEPAARSLISGRHRDVLLEEQGLQHLPGRLPQPVQYRCSSAPVAASRTHPAHTAPAAVMLMLSPARFAHWRTGVELMSV